MGLRDERHDPGLHAVDDERGTVQGYIDFFRDTIEWKCAGLSDEHLDRALAPSTMTLGGMLSHLSFVEDHWFTHVWQDRLPSEPWCGVDWKADPDWDWHRARDIPGDQLRTEWRAAVARSQAVIDAEGSLDALSAGTLGDGETRISLRWLMQHLVEEYGRHCGHADLLAQAADGRTGE